MKRSAPAKRAVRAKKPARSSWVGVGTLAVVMVCMSAAAMLSAALRSGEVSEDATASPQPETVAEVQSQPTRPVDIVVVDARSKGAKDRAALPVDPVQLLEQTESIDGTNHETTLTASTASIDEAAPVTITGCLELDDETFRLKNTTGLDAPKSRSWRTGFLKKSPASIDVVDASNSLRLPDHVGAKVSVTGMLVDREMQVRSLQRLGTSCDQQA